MQTADVARRIKMMLEKGYKYVLVFGAGISKTSGIPSSASLKQAILATLSPEANIGDFDDIWRGLSDRERDAAIFQHVSGKEPSTGYEDLLALLSASYFDIVLTFNFDDLIEKTLERFGFSDFETIVGGVDSEAEARRKLCAAKPRVKLLKLHGDVRKSYYHYSLDQLLEFHPDVKLLFTELSARELIVCGYSFNDLDVLRAIALENAGAIYFVNVESPSKLVKEILRKRNSVENCIVGADGDWDTFASELRRSLA